MSELLNLLFGQGPLKKAAAQGAAPAPKNNQDAGIDIPALAQQQADAAAKARAQAKIHAAMSQSHQQTSNLLAGQSPSTPAPETQTSAQKP